MRGRIVNDAQRTRAGGFTLVELLTVVAIIVLLIGILVPAVNKVRISAKETATKALIGTFSTGLETLRADQQIGGAYPPSRSDMGMGSVGGTFNLYQVASPYENLENHGLDAFEISGAGLLVWALAGADLLGPPGFRTFRDDNHYWSEDTDAKDEGDEAGAYALDLDTQQPLRPRVEPFVDLSKVEVTRWNAQAETRDGAGSFEIPTENEAREALGQVPSNSFPKRNYPMFLDSFGGPVLYWRADPAGMQIADRPPRNPNPQNRGIYHYLDNGALLRSSDIGSGVGTNQDPVLLRPANPDDPHRLWFLPVAPGAGNQDLDGFPLYVQNRTIQARPEPHNPKTYLLISAGADGVFGTADDIANFEHNGAELKERR